MLAEGQPVPERMVFAAEADMTVGAEAVRPLAGGDGKSGATLLRLRIDDQPYVLKRTDLDRDWTMRATGDSFFRPRLVWERGIMHRAPTCIDHATVAMAVEDGPDGTRLSILMRDIGRWIVPEGDTVITLDQHHGFVDHMAALAAEFWGFDDPADVAELTTLTQRVQFFCLDLIETELARPDPPATLQVAAQGWRELPERAPALADLVLPLQADPAPLVEAMQTTPQTVHHGDRKLGNLGRHPDGRTILLDWAYPGPGPAALELAWYLALNADRLPETKEDTIERYRTALEGLGIDTGRWWARQLGLSLIAIMVMFGWEKSLTSSPELAWWDERAAVERRWLE
jgi:hypothetical protein